MSLQGKTVVVIGGSSGIGLTTAKALVDAGARVIISSRSEEKLEEAKNAIEGEVEAYSLDVTREEDVKRVGKPEDVAKAVLYLILNDYTTGTVLEVNGGYRIV